jgi:hypothetical protein
MEKSRIEKHWDKVAGQEKMLQFRQALGRREPPLPPLPPLPTNAAPAAPELPVAQLEEWARSGQETDLTWLRSGWTLLLLALWVLACGRALKRQWRPLRKIAPASVATWELAFTKRRAQALIAAWNAHLPESRVRRLLRVQLGLDFLFIPAYSFLLAGVCWRTAHWLEATRPSSGLAIDLAALAVLPLAAGCLDVFENLCLYATLTRKGPRQPWQALAGAAAALKFLLLGVVLLGLLGAWFLA